MRAERLRVLVDHDLSGLHNFLDLFKKLAKDQHSVPRT